MLIFILGVINFNQTGDYLLDQSKTMYIIKSVLAIQIILHWYLLHRDLEMYILVTIAVRRLLQRRYMF